MCPVSTDVAQGMQLPDELKFLPSSFSLAEETRNPARVVPLAMVTSVIAVSRLQLRLLPPIFA